MRPRAHRSWMPVVVVAACAGSPDQADDVGGDTPDPPGRDASPVDTDPPAETDETDAPPASTHPDPRWTELLGAWCPPGRCRTAWYDPTLTDVQPAVIDTVIAGRGVFGADDPRVIVLVDVRRDDDGDGVHERRGLVLAYDPVTGTLVDPPDLPDDFDAAGLAPEVPGTSPIAGIVDLDGDGAAEVLWTGSSPVWRWDRDRARFVADAAVTAALPEHVRQGLTVAALDVSDLDDDGRLELQIPLPVWAADTSGTGPVLTLSPQGDGTWRFLDLHDLGGAERAWPPGIAGFTAVRDGIGGPRLEVLPGDGYGSCWIEAGRTPEGFPRMAPCDLDAGRGGVDLGLNLETPMGAALGGDFDRDGRPELLVSTGKRALSLLDVDTVWEDRLFDDWGAAVNLRVPFPCDLDAPIAPDADGVGWTCPTAPEGSRNSLAWGVATPDLDRDGWTDAVSVFGDDHDSFVLCPSVGARCIAKTPIGLWYATGETLPGARGLPSFEPVGLARFGADVPPVGTWQGLAGVNLDGDADDDWLLSSTGTGFPAVFRDDTPTGHHGFCLVPHGVVSNPLGVGSDVEVTTDDGVTRRLQVTSGGNPNVVPTPEPCFGTGLATEADVVWRWPSGFVQRLAGVPAMADGEPARWPITEPAWLTLLDADGAPAPSGVAPAGEALIARLCRFDEAPVAFGATPVPHADRGAWTVRTTGATVAVTVGAAVPGPPGCVDVPVRATGRGETRLQIDAGAGTLPARPRLRWR